MPNGDVLLKKGTGHILQDLLSSKVRLNRPNFVYRRPGRSSKTDENNSSPEELRSCSICSESTNLRPLALQEMEILAKFVLSQEQISLILKTEDHPPIFCCKICSSAILSLAKLTTQIENITISLRAVISSRNGLFNKLRKETTKITELLHDVGAAKISRTGKSCELTFVAEASDCHNDDDLPLDNDGDEQLIPGDDISVKDEPLDDNEDDDDDSQGPEITPDSDYEPEDNKSEESGEESEAKSDAEDDDAAKLPCDLCQPNVTFTRYDALRRHVMNKKIHGDLKPADYMPTLNRAKQKKRLVLRLERRFPCAKCEKRFSCKDAVYRHNRTVHEGIRYQRKCDLCPATFYESSAFHNHMFKKHKVPLPASAKKRSGFSHACDMCDKTFTMKVNINRHVELVHFPDKTSCPYGCPDKFGSEAEWVTHLEGCESPKITIESASVCNHCNAVLRNALLRMEHYFREHSDKLYTCALCGEKFTIRDCLYNHICTANSSGNLGFSRRDNYSCNMLLQDV